MEFSYKFITSIIQMKQNGGDDKRSVDYKAPINVTSNSTVHLFVVTLNTLLQFGLKSLVLKYNVRFTDLNLWPLSFRRDCADLVLFYKRLHGLYEVQLEDFIETNIHGWSLRSISVKCFFHPKRSKTTSFRQSFLNRVVHLWNTLWQNIRSNQPLYSFQSRLQCYFNNLVCLMWMIGVRGQANVACVLETDNCVLGKHQGNGQPTSNLRTLIDVYELPSARIGERGDSLLPLWTVNHALFDRFSMGM